MVLLWHVGEKALVANIHLDDTIYVCLDKKKKDFPIQLMPYVEKDLIQLLNDVSDNSIFSLLYDLDFPTKEIKAKLFSVVAEEEKEEYINMAIEQGIKI